MLKNIVSSPKAQFATAFGICIVLTGIATIVSSNSQPDYAVTLRLSHARTAGSIADLTAHKFKELVERKSENQIGVQIFPNNGMSGGDQSGAVDMLKDGTIDIQICSATDLYNLDKRFGTFWLPFIFDNDDQINYFVQDEDVHNVLGSWLKPHGVDLLTMYSAGARQLSNNVHEITSPADLEGIKFRVPPFEGALTTFEALGAQAVKMDFSSVGRALENNEIQGQESNVAAFISAKLYKQQPFLTLWNGIYDTQLWIANDDSFQKLSDSQKEAFTQSLEETMAWRANLTTEFNKLYLKTLEDRGVKITELSPEQKALFREKALPIYERYVEALGYETLNFFLENQGLQPDQVKTLLPIEYHAQSAAQDTIEAMPEMVDPAAPATEEAAPVEPAATEEAAAPATEEAAPVEPAATEEAAAPATEEAAPVEPAATEEAAAPVTEEAAPVEPAATEEAAAPATEEAAPVEPAATEEAAAPATEEAAPVEPAATEEAAAPATEEAAPVEPAATEEAAAPAAEEAAPVEPAATEEAAAPAAEEADPVEPAATEEAAAPAAEEAAPVEQAAQEAAATATEEAAPVEPGAQETAPAAEEAAPVEPAATEEAAAPATEEAAPVEPAAQETAPAEVVAQEKVEVVVEEVSTPVEQAVVCPPAAEAPSAGSVDVPAVAGFEPVVAEDKPAVKGFDIPAVIKPVQPVKLPKPAKHPAPVQLQYIPVGESSIQYIEVAPGKFQAVQMIPVQPVQIVPVDIKGPDMFNPVVTVKPAPVANEQPDLRPMTRPSHAPAAEEFTKPVQPPFSKPLPAPVPTVVGTGEVAQPMTLEATEAHGPAVNLPEGAQIEETPAPESVEAPAK